MFSPGPVPFWVESFPLPPPPPRPFRSPLNQQKQDTPTAGGFANAACIWPTLGASVAVYNVQTSGSMLHNASGGSTKDRQGNIYLKMPAGIVTIAKHQPPLGVARRPFDTRAAETIAAAQNYMKLGQP